MSLTNLKPVFLIGAGRSGTKFLRDVLSNSSEIALIPYDVGYVWRYGNESIPHDELSRGLLNKKIKKYIRTQLPKLIKDKDFSRNHFFIEKSVPNSLRVEFLHEIYPEAKFIHLIRDGRAVTESSIRMWSNPPQKNYLLDKLKYFPWNNYKYAFWYLGNLIKGKVTGRGQHIWGPRYKGIDSDLRNFSLELVCSRQWRRCVEIATEQLEKISTDQRIEIRYEKLMQTDLEIKRICKFLEINDSEKVSSIFNEQVNSDYVAQWKNRLNDSQLNIMLDEIGGLLKDLGYE